MRIRNIAGLLIAIFAVLTLLDRFVLVELLVRRTFVPLLVASFEALAMIAAGALLRRTKRLNVPLDLLIGYPILGTALFLVSTLKIALWTVLPLVAAGALGGVWLLLRRRGDSESEDLSLPLHWSAFAVAAVLACGFVAAQAPATSLDELAYHLAVPHAWVLEGRAIELPLSSHSYFPLGIESADVLPLLLLGPVDGSVASHLLHLLAAIATTLLIARRTQSWLATAAIVTTPALAIIAGWSLVDWPLTGLFVALYTALEDDDLHAASALTAAGLLTKYTFAPFALVLWILKRRIPLWTAALGAVFFVRNLILTGNPVAPFLADGAPHVSGFRDVALADYIFEGAFVDEALGASLLSLVPFAAGIPALVVLGLAAALFLLAPSSRILVPFLAVPAVAAAPELRRRVLASVVAVAVVIQTLLVVWFTARSGAFALVSGASTEAEYLRKTRPSYATIEWLNSILPVASRTLIVGHGETYWFSRPVRGGGNFDGPRLSRYLDLPTAEAVRERLRNDGITHVVVMSALVRTEVEQKRRERQTRLDPSAQRVLAQMLDHYATSVMAKDGTALFALK